MCTVIKVKRKITEDPVDCLILECKKRRKQLAPNLENQISNDASSSPTNRIDSIKQILKYAGSAKNEVGSETGEFFIKKIIFFFIW